MNPPTNLDALEANILASVVNPLDDGEVIETNTGNDEIDKVTLTEIEKFRVRQAQRDK